MVKAFAWLLAGLLCWWALAYYTQSVALAVIGIVIVAGNFAYLVLRPVSYFERFTGIEKHIRRLPWRQRLKMRWHLWRLARAESRLVRKAKQIIGAGSSNRSAEQR